jgi:hypothetical protein
MTLFLTLFLSSFSTHTNLYIEEQARKKRQREMLQFFCFVIFIDMKGRRSLERSAGGRG